MRRQVLLCVPSLVLFLASSVMCAAHAVSPRATVVTTSDTTIGVDDNLDAYIGSGGLLLPSTFSGTVETRNHVASCLSCIWKYTLYCSQDATVACAHAVTTCSPGLVRYRVKFGTEPSQLETIGTVCWGHSRPTTRRDISTQLRQEALRRVPALHPGYAPHNLTLTGVPIVVWSGQPSVFQASPMQINSFTITVTAHPIWRWSWGDSASQWTSNPGSSERLSGPIHNYRTGGTYLLKVQTVWQARYDIEGIGNYQLNDGPINQYATLKVHVLGSRTVLMDPHS